MESIAAYFSNIGLDLGNYLRLACTVLLGALVLSGLLRFIFKKQSLLGHAISSSIAVIFIYVVMVLILTFETGLGFLAAPLPFVSITRQELVFFSLQSAEYTAVCCQLLSMIILAFLVNLAESWIPEGSNLFTWTLLRALTVALGLVMHFAANWLFNKYLPQGVLTYAPAILLGILVLMLLTGALRFLVGLVLTAVNPLIAALYTFFFSTVVGKQITRSVLTTGLLSGVVLMLEKMEITSLALHPEAMIAYFPFLLVLILVWYVVGRV